MHEHSERSYLPAAGKDWLLPLYDPIQRLLGGEAARRELIEQARVEAGQRLLDVGCGTGDLVVALKRAFPACEVVGIDPDPKALARAARKAARAGVSVRLERGFADALPFEAGRFDRVFSSFMFHHLGADQKQAMLGEVLRVLGPGGSLHLLDFGGSHTHDRGLLARMLHSAEDVRENFGGRIPERMRAAGFAEVAETGQRGTLFGRIAFHRAATAPQPAAGSPA